MAKNIINTGFGLLLFLIVFGVVAYIVNPEAMQANQEQTMAEKQRPSIDFTVTKEESDQFKRSLEIVLATRVDEVQLRNIAEYLYQDRPGNTFIGYYIEGEGDYAYWATTHYDPGLNIRIIGSSQAEDQSLSSAENDNEGNIVGKWRVNRGYNSVVTIVESGSEKRLIQRFQDGGEMDNPIEERVVEGKVRLSDGIGESNGEYYIIGDDGRLQFWSNNGNYYTAPIDR